MYQRTFFICSSAKPTRNPISQRYAEKRKRDDARMDDMIKDKQQI